jgi:hypothetical protein
MELLSRMVRTAAEEVAALGDVAADIAALASAELRSAQDRVNALRLCADRYAAMVAGEIAHRSRPEVGNAGLAQSSGFVSPEAMIQSFAKVNRTEAVKLVKVGTIIAETEAAIALAVEGGYGAQARTDGEDSAADPAAALGPVAPPWQAPLVAALSDGRLPLDCVEAIRRALGDIDPGVPASSLTSACEQLISSAAGLNPDQLFRRATQLRDSLDEEGIERREKVRRDLRRLRTWWDPEGTYNGHFRLPPEEGMIVASAIDQALSPRRGGVRMVDPGAKAAAEELLNDPRSTEQIAADVLVDIFRLATDADPGTFFGRKRPAVRVMVTDAHLHARKGHGRIESHPDAVSFATVERHLCDTGAIAVRFDDDGQCVNVGRNQRLFTERQRTGMAVRDGGCLFPSCDRPPAWCEAHHIDQWHRDDGRTDIADGILLCRRHHLLLHNNHWHVLRRDGDYHLRPPRAVDPDQTLIPMPSRNPEIRAIRSLSLSKGREP